jgi:hypothetical protein
VVCVSAWADTLTNRTNALAALSDRDFTTSPWALGGCLAQRVLGDGPISVGASRSRPSSGCFLPTHALWSNCSMASLEFLSARAANAWRRPSSNTKEHPLAPRHRAIILRILPLGLALAGLMHLLWDLNAKMLWPFAAPAHPIASQLVAPADRPRPSPVASGTHRRHPAELEVGARALLLLLVAEIRARSTDSQLALLPYDAHRMCKTEPCVSD